MYQSSVPDCSKEMRDSCRSMWLRKATSRMAMSPMQALAMS